MKKWIQEDIEILIECKGMGLHMSDIAEILNRTEESVKSKWKKINYKPIPTEIWPEQDLKIILEGHSLLKLQELLPHHTRRAIQAKKEMLGNRDDYKNWSDQSLLDIIIKYVDKNLLNKYRVEGEPSAIVIERRFGSWSKAKSLCNLSCVLYDLPTLLYLVDFGEFKKVGITHQTVENRLKSAGKDYTLLDTRLYETRYRALEAEQFILKSVHRIRGDILTGPTECFVDERLKLEEYLTHFTRAG